MTATTMTCDWCGREFPADARACVEVGFNACGVDGYALSIDPGSVSQEDKDEIKGYLQLDDAQVDQLLSTGSVDGLGGIICAECQEETP